MCKMPKLTMIFGGETLDQFKTLKGYNRSPITYAMEDYLEMICRFYQEDGFIRINNLAFKLGVSPPSASKMVANLKKKGLVEYEKYGVVRPTEKGIEFGNYLLYRHQVLTDFFTVINGNEDMTDEIEPIEHYLSKETIENIKTATDLLQDNKKDK